MYHKKHKMYCYKKLKLDREKVRNIRNIYYGKNKTQFCILCKLHECYYKFHNGAHKEDIYYIIE